MSLSGSDIFFCFQLITLDTIERQAILGSQVRPHSQS